MVANLARQSDQMGRLSLSLATGQRIARPSDDLTGAVRALTAMNSHRHLAGRQRATDLTEFLGTSLETATQNVADVIGEARVLAARAGNELGDTPDQDAALAEEVNQLLESLVETANHRALGRYVYGGKTPHTAPYTPTRDVNGDITGVVATPGIEDPITRLVGDAEVQVPITGPSIFAGGGDAFQALIDLRDAILASDAPAVATAAADLDAVESNVASELAAVGSFLRRIESEIADLEERTTNMEAERSRAMDTDVAEAILQLTSAETFYQAALQVSARVSQLSLVNFI